MRFDFVEIGTSDFATEIQKAAGRRGLSVEPVSEHLERLPSPPTVIKSCCGVSGEDSEMQIYYVPAEVIEALGLPKWVRGCNRIGGPHPTVVNYLAKYGHPASVIAVKTVPVMTFATLCTTHGVSEIDYLKIDTEGHDIVILRSLVAAVGAGVVAWPRRIKAECYNSLNSQAVRKETETLLKEAGYTTERVKHDIIATRSD